MTMPVPGLVAASEFSSTHPLKTEPNPPSPRTLSGRKFLVAIFNSLKLKFLILTDCKISPSLLGVGGTDPDDSLLPSLLTYFEFTSTQYQIPSFCQIHMDQQLTINLQNRLSNYKKSNSFKNPAVYKNFQQPITIHIETNKTQTAIQQVSENAVNKDCHTDW